MLPGTVSRTVDLLMTVWQTSAIVSASCEGRQILTKAAFGRAVLPKWKPYTVGMKSEEILTNSTKLTNIEVYDNNILLLI